MPMRDLIEQFISERDELKKADPAYFSELLSGIEQQRAALEQQLGPLLDRPLANLDPVEKAVLLLGLYELLFHPELDHQIIINEAVELAKMFGAEASFKYVNGVLDQAARRIRMSPGTAGDDGVRI